MYSAYSTYIHKQHLKVKMNTLHMNIYLLIFGYKSTVTPGLTRRPCWKIQPFEDCSGENGGKRERN